MNFGCKCFDDSPLDDLAEASHLEVVDQPDLLLALVGWEANPAASEDEIAEFDQFGVLLDEKFDAVSVLVKRGHKEFLEVDEFVNDIQLIRKSFKEFLWRCPVDQSYFLCSNTAFLQIKDLRSHIFIEP